MRIAGALGVARVPFEGGMHRAGRGAGPFPGIEQQYKEDIDAALEDLSSRARAARNLDASATERARQTEYVVPTGDWRAPAYEQPRTKGGVGDVRPMPTATSGVDFGNAVDEAWTLFSAAINGALVVFPAAARAALPCLTSHDEQTLLRMIQGILPDLAHEAEGLPGVTNTKEFGVLE